MKFKLAFILVVFLIGCKQKQSDIVQTEKNVDVSIKLDTTYLFKAKPKAGFNFDYYVYIPEHMDLSSKNNLLVESTNTGVNDSIEHHQQGAKYAASKSSVGNFVSNKLKIPLLVPIFPRSETNWKYYTHALDSETFNDKGTDIERLDLQLLAMVEDAKKELKLKGVKLHNRFFMTGFSASGTFANRFSILHPDKIKAVCGGGFNGILILPLENKNGKALNFPIGIADVEEVTGQQVDLEAFKQLPQFWFMGAKDNNDAVEYDDGYTEHERQLVHSEIGKQMMPNRWDKVQNIYLRNDIQAIFETYDHMGHGTDLIINNAIAYFFEKHIEK